MYKGELIRDVQEVFPKDLPNNPTQKDVTTYLRARLRQETGGF
jgi:hypothetical protein